MKLTKKTCKLITELEEIIGGCCYNPESYNGWTGEYGKYFRYPVVVRDKTTGEEHKYSYTIDELDKNNIENVYYKFGANRLRIGVGVMRVLEYLEKYYGLDFNEIKKASKTKSKSEDTKH